MITVIKGQRGTIYTRVPLHQACCRVVSLQLAPPACLGKKKNVCVLYFLAPLDPSSYELREERGELAELRR